MIHVSRLDGKAFVINCELIGFIEETPDTVLTMVNGEKFVILEAADEVISRVIEYRHLAYGDIAWRQHSA
jgi:flagellar protein FlbD